jgi:hypothetical protein
MENALAVALIDHALAIKHALSQYQRPAQHATQSELMRRFEDVFEPELASLASSLPETDTSTPTQPTGQSPTPMERHQSVKRSTSPEQEPIRSSRGKGHTRKRSDRQSVSHRISVINPFKRSHNGGSNSIFTIQQSDSKATGISSVGEGEEGADDDADTIHSRATSRSRGGGRSEKRRSFFGGDKLHKHGSTPSVTNADEAQSSQLKSQASRSQSRDTAGPDDSGRRSGSQPPGPATNGGTGGGPKTGGWSTLPSTRDYSRPVTRDSATVQSPSTTNGTAAPAAVNSKDPPVRDSMFRRFSLLKGVGRKSSRMDFRANGTLQEE